LTGYLACAMTSDHGDRASDLFRTHPRSFHENRYVYPVVSRRSGGVSIGVNLNRDRVCNFHCVYCQVDRTTLGPKDFVDLRRLAEELDATLELATSGRLFDDPQFCRTPESLRTVRDVALSGDGEPTTYRNFDEVVSTCIASRNGRGLSGVNVVLITNASMFHRRRVQEGLRLLDQAGGEIWAKLDAGTDDYYRRIARSKIPFCRILANLQLAARERPIVIQSLFLRMHGQAPPADELDAYVRRLEEIVSSGGRIKLVQIHTIARTPAEPWVTALADAELETLASRVRARTGLPVAVFYGARPDREPADGT
jgi:wyosine [tRNA(Phe)-imidazoG37] synthetase (radical SAM superfamily)